MFYYFCHFMSLHVIVFYFEQPFGQVSGKKLSFWFSGCRVLIVVPLLLDRPSFPWCLGRKVVANCINSCLLLSFLYVNKDKLLGIGLTLVMLNPDIPHLFKQCRSRSVGF